MKIVHRCALTYPIVPIVLLGVILFASLFMSGCGNQQTATLSAARVPTLAAGETPNYTTHIAPIFAQHCVSCHSGSLPAASYVVTSYESVMTGGTNGPNVVAGQLDSNLVRMVRREAIPAGGPMPPSYALSSAEVALIVRWVETGAAQQ